MSLAVDEQSHDLLVIRDAELLQELFAVHEEGNDPVPADGVGLIVAHGGGFPPAEEDVLFAGDGQLVVAELKAGVLHRLGGGHPRFDILLLLGLEGDEQQIGLALEAARDFDLLFVEILSGNLGKDGLLWRLGSHQRRTPAKQQRRQPWFMCPQCVVPAVPGIWKKLEEWYHLRRSVPGLAATPAWDSMTCVKGMRKPTMLRISAGLFLLAAAAFWFSSARWLSPVEVFLAVLLFAASFLPALSRRS